MPDGWALLATDNQRPVVLEKDLGSFRLTVARDLTRSNSWSFLIDCDGATVATISADAIQDENEAARAAEAWAREYVG